MSYPPLRMNEVMRFGKYGKLGKKVSEMITTDPEYCRWLINEKIAEFDNEAYQHLVWIEEHFGRGTLPSEKFYGDS